MKNFTMSEVSWEQVKLLPDESQKFRMISALMEYAFNGIEPDFNGIESAVFLPMKVSVDVSRELPSQRQGLLGGRQRV
jgi:hypothetical protein